MMDETLDLPLVHLEAPAPDFTARSTQGVVRLSAFRGQWVMLFSHPADFTPVCTSEFIAFEKALPQFEARNCQLLGLSVDSVYAHLAWIVDIESRFGTKITFPIIEDVSMSVARAYGMISPRSATTATVRSVFVIDPQGITRAIVHYPMQVGRSVSELLRLLAGLQAVEDGTMAVPEGWQPGESGVLPPPASVEEADVRARPNGTDNAWYFTKVRSEQGHDHVDPA